MSVAAAQNGQCYSSSSLSFKLTLIILLSLTFGALGLLDDANVLACSKISFQQAPNIWSPFGPALNCADC